MFVLLAWDRSVRVVVSRCRSVDRAPISRSMFAVALGLSLISLGTGVAPAQSVFKDDALVAVARKFVYDKRFSDKPITGDDVKNLSTLRGRKAGVKTLDGLASCKALAELELSGGAITDLGPLADLTQLQSVDLSDNKITDLGPIAKLEKLQYLNVEKNQITNLRPIENLGNLRSLYITGNQVTSLDPVTKAKKLWSLYAGDNKLTSVDPLAELPALSVLDLQNNELTDISPLKNLSELRFLLLQNNQISDLAPLVKRASDDAAGPQRFAPYLKLYLAGNPLSDEAKTKQVEALKSAGVTVILEDSVTSASAEK